MFPDPRVSLIAVYSRDSRGKTTSVVVVMVGREKYFPLKGLWGGNGDMGQGRMEMGVGEGMGGGSLLWDSTGVVYCCRCPLPVVVFDFWCPRGLLSNTCFADLPSSMSNQPIDQLTILLSVLLSACLFAPFVLTLAPFLCLMSVWCQLDVSLMSRGSLPFDHTGDFQVPHYACVSVREPVKRVWHLHGDGDVFINHKGSYLPLLSENCRWHIRPIQINFAFTWFPIFFLLVRTTVHKDSEIHKAWVKDGF